MPWRRRVSYDVSMSFIRIAFFHPDDEFYHFIGCAHTSVRRISPIVVTGMDPCLSIFSFTS